MASIERTRFLTLFLAILFAVTSGCGDSAPTDQPTEPPEVTQDAPDETVSDEPSADVTPVEPDGLLGIGSPAPALMIANWVTGEGIDAFQSDQVYVIEFWATWCPPCRTSMPHLSTLQQQFGDDVKFIGVTREPEGTVLGFLEQEQSEGMTWADVVKYTLATDSADATNTAYMNAAKQSGIPTAFIVGKDAVIEWIGHPMRMDEPLSQVVAGTWDRQAAIEEVANQQRLKELSRELGVKVRAEAWDEALKMLAELEAETGESPQLTQTRLTILQKAGRTQEAAKLQIKIVDQAWDSAGLLNEIAWGLATSRGDRDLDLALKAATRASELTDDKHAPTIDTLARVYYELGRLDDAITWQKKAVEFGQGNSEIAKSLKKYEEENAKQADEDSVGK